MLIKLGVYIDSLNAEIRGTLDDIDELFIGKNHEAVITSTNESNHKPSSSHYANNAIDFRLPFGSVAILAEEMKKVLGVQFRIKVEKTHIHVEYIGGKKST